MSILRHEHGALNHVIELAHIAGKRMLQQSFPGGFVEPDKLLAITLPVLEQKMVRQRQDVFAAVAQRRQRDLDRV